MSRDDTQRSQRRIIVPEKPAKVQPSAITLQVDAPTLIQDALSVIATEIVKFKSKTSTGQSLDLAEARVLQGYIKALVELSKETREREADMDLANMSDAEILGLIQALQSRTKSPQPERIVSANNNEKEEQ